MTNGASCLCLTYGRPALLEEAIESFIRQDWDGPKELIVLNDHPKQELVFEHPEVRVFNLDARVPTLGEKRNLSVQLAQYDRLLIWDDDDIHLPWRISESMKVLAEAEYFKCPQLWRFLDDGFYHHVSEQEEWYHCTAAYRRSLFDELGGYTAMNTGEDTSFDRRLKGSPSLGRFWKLSELPLDRLYYIYRVTHGHYRTTGCTDLSKIDPPVKVGRLKLEPHWETDYCEKVAREVDRMRFNQSLSSWLCGERFC